jgi:hypothetical protein
VVVTVDLGQVYAINEVVLHSCSETSCGIYYPGAASLSVSQDNVNYTAWGSSESFPSNTGGMSADSAVWTPGWVNARYVRFNVTEGAVNSWMFLDELMVYGTCPNSPWKLAPSTGCYHGAYPTDSYNYLDIPTFETPANKTIRTALWYADCSNTYTNEIGWIITDGVLDTRYFEIGWEPENETSSQLATGVLDAFWYTWFQACASQNYPIFLRPMSEMNGSWTWPNGGTALQWGGNPQSYKWAWQRMYNIAQAAGATGTNQIFVWSPDVNPGASGVTPRNLTLYYPGEQYVDWVGCSCYAWTPGVSSFESLLSTWYSLYSANKPLMISEGGSQEDSSDPNWKGNTWIHDWFYCTENSYPDIKQVVWFNDIAGNDFAIQTSANSTAKYALYDQPSYFIGK